MVLDRGGDGLVVHILGRVVDEEAKWIIPDLDQSSRASLGSSRKSNLKLGWALTGVVQWPGHCLAHREDAGLIPSRAHA